MLNKSVHSTVTSNETELVRIRAEFLSKMESEADMDKRDRNDIPQYASTHPTNKSRIESISECIDEAQKIQSDSDCSEVRDQRFHVVYFRCLLFFIDSRIQNLSFNYLKTNKVNNHSRYLL